MDNTILTPPGRLVMGSLYTPSTEDFNGNKRDKPQFWFKLAIPKKEAHWKDSAWGAKIWASGESGFSAGGEHLKEGFHWMVFDGDSADCAGKDGHAGCWILKFKSIFAPILLDSNADPLTLPPGSINLGDYIEVYGSASSNGLKINSGMYLNFSHISFVGYGEKILFIDPKTVGFGQSPLPEGARSPTAGYVPAPAVAPVAMPASPAAPGPSAVAMPAAPVETAPVSPAAPAPYPEILTPPAAKSMTAKANNIPYADYIAKGWTEAQLIEHGLMA